MHVTADVELWGGKKEEEERPHQELEEEDLCLGMP